MPLEHDTSASIPNLNGALDLVEAAADQEVEVDPISRSTCGEDSVVIGRYTFMGLVLAGVGCIMSRSESPLTCQGFRDLILSLERTPETGRLRFMDVNEAQEREVSHMSCRADV